MAATLVRRGITRIFHGVALARDGSFRLHAVASQFCAAGLETATAALGDRAARGREIALLAAKDPMRAPPIAFLTAKDAMGGPEVGFLAAKNAILGVGSASWKLRSYANTLLWNETLRSDSYKSKLDFKELSASKGLAFKPFAKFGPHEVEERQELLFDLCTLIWPSPVEEEQPCFRR